MTTQNDGSLSLLDIGPLTEHVPMGDGYMKVYGVSAAGAISIFQRFPHVAVWFKGGGKPTLEQLINEAPDALAAVIAAGCGNPGNEIAEANAKLMPLETQVDLLEAIGRLTFSKG